jgi:hypothetical protein
MAVFRLVKAMTDFSKSSFLLLFFKNFLKNNNKKEDLEKSAEAPSMSCNIYWLLHYYF